MEIEESIKVWKRPGQSEKGAFIRLPLHLKANCSFNYS